MTYAIIRLHKDTTHDARRRRAEKKKGHRENEMQARLHLMACLVMDYEFAQKYCRHTLPLSTSPLNDQDRTSAALETRNSWAKTKSCWREVGRVFQLHVQAVHAVLI